MEARTPMDPGRVRGAGWAFFVAVLFLILGTFNAIDGIVALAEDDNFVSDELFFGDLAMWGVFLLIIGGLQLLAAFRLFDGKGQLLAIGLLSLNLVVQLFFVGVYPVWSIIIMVINAMAIYGLTVYGEQFEP
jgi:hypothetical protein